MMGYRAYSVCQENFKANLSIPISVRLESEVLFVYFVNSLNGNAPVCNWLRNVLGGIGNVTFGIANHVQQDNAQFWSYLGHQLLFQQRY